MRRSTSAPIIFIRSAYESRTGCSSNWRSIRSNAAVHGSVFRVLRSCSISRFGSVNHPHPPKALLLDIDGTLVDSNDAHAHAWVKAFAEANIHVEFHNVRCAIGMGGEKLMPAVAGIEEDSPLGERISRRRGEIFKSEYLPNLRPFRDAGA